MSQERVLTLLFNKTFPPRSNSSQPSSLPQTESIIMSDHQQMVGRREEFAATEDVQTLEREIDAVFRAKTAAAN